MKNIHVLPTDKPSRLFYNVGGALLFTNYENHNGVNIYITSDEEIKVGDYYITILDNEIFKADSSCIRIMNDANKSSDTTYKNTHFKIILTTDQDLIKDGVQAIDDEFLEWFVKNPSCERVETVFNNRGITGAEKILKTFGEYKIIIPKEEAKQETLEEFIQRQLSLGKYQDQESAIKYSILSSAKWQQEQFGKSEFLQKLRATISDAEARRLIFETFKNK